ncbi:MAG: c-type cytochrome [Flavobacteriales bacterium]
MNKALKYNILLVGAALVCITMLMSSCTKDPNSPGVEYMPDMYRSPSYETYSTNPVFKDSMTAQLPVAGTISRGEWPASASIINALPYAYEESLDGYLAAGEGLTNPIEKSDEVVAEGKVIFEKMCMHCHGKEGKGDGQLVQIEKFPPPPSYSSPQLKELSVGKMFHTITYGKGLMGSHASQLTKEERWKVIHYIQELQKL